jgi:hypothetical protein
VFNDSRRNRGNARFFPPRRKDAQFFRRDAELVREVWLTSGQLNMNQNPQAETAALQSLTRKIDIISLAA